MNRATSQCRRGAVTATAPGIAAALLALAVQGCAASARDVYEPVLRYSSGHRGYVAIRQGAHAEDDLARALPTHGSDYVVVLHPMTRKKLRCAEDVTFFANALGRIASRPIEDQHRRTISLSVLFPVTVAGGAAIAIGAGLVGVALGPYWFTQPDPPSRLTALGMAAYDRGDDARAIDLLLQSAASDPAHARTSLTLFELGRAYARTRQQPQSVVALSTFLEEAVVWNGSAYDEAERLLSGFGVQAAKCNSVAAVPMTWP